MVFQNFKAPFLHSLKNFGLVCVATTRDETAHSQPCSHFQTGKALKPACKSTRSASKAKGVLDILALISVSGPAPLQTPHREALFFLPSSPSCWLPVLPFTHLPRAHLWSTDSVQALGWGRRGKEEYDRPAALQKSPPTRPLSPAIHETRELLRSQGEAPTQLHPQHWLRNRVTQGRDCSLPLIPSHRVAGVTGGTSAKPEGHACAHKSERKSGCSEKREQALPQPVINAG